MGILKEKKLLEPVMETVRERIDGVLRRRSGEGLSIEAVMFSTEEGVLGKTKGADALLEQIRREDPEARCETVKDTV